MPRQVLELVDYFAPLAALVMFALAILLFSFFIVNFFYIVEKDDLTVFEKFGAQHDLCLGPHAMSDIYRGGPKMHPRSEEAQIVRFKKEGQKTTTTGTAAMASSSAREGSKKAEKY